MCGNVRRSPLALIVWTMMNANYTTQMAPSSLIISQPTVYLFTISEIPLSLSAKLICCYGHSVWTGLGGAGTILVGYVGFPQQNKEYSRLVLLTAVFLLDEMRLKRNTSVSVCKVMCHHYAPYLSPLLRHFLCALFIPRFEMITSSLRLMKEGQIKDPLCCFQIAKLSCWEQ